MSADSPAVSESSPLTRPTRNEPPYYLGAASWNVGTDSERFKFVWLTEFMNPDDGNSGP